MQSHTITDGPNGQDANDGVLAGAELENPYTGHAGDCPCRECAFEGAPVEQLTEAELGYRRELPPVNLHRLPDWLAEDDLPDGWQLPLLAPAGAVTLFSADPKAGKTQLLLALLTAAQQGQSVLGTSVAQGISVAWLTEEKRPSIRRALHRVGMDLNNLPADWWVGSYHDRAAKPVWANMADHLAELWAINGVPDICVVDTIGRWAACDDWNSYSRVIEATEPLHQLANQHPRMAVIAIHHNKKGGGDIISAASGSNALTGAVDHIVSMSKVGSDEGDANTRKLKFLSRFDVADETLLVRWEPTTGAYTVVTAGARMKDLIRETLDDASEPLTVAEVCERLPMQDDGTQYKPDTVKARLFDGAKVGLWVTAGKRGKSNLYAIRTPYIPLV